jgi:hypothetical protein
MLIASTKALCLFGGPIQATRELTQAALGSFSFKAFFALLALGVIIPGARAALDAGKSAGREHNDLGRGDLVRLGTCLVIDLIGLASYGLGEQDDLVWAPISALLLRSLFKSDRLAAFNFLKEILPLTDAIPAATIAWLLDNVFVSLPLSRALGLGEGGAPGER